MDAAQAALLTAGVTVALAGAVGYGLYRLINVSDPKTPADWGRKWLSWSLFLACISKLPSFFRNLDANSLVVWILISVVSGAIGFSIGWVYGRFFKCSNNDDARTSSIVSKKSKPNEGAADQSYDNSSAAQGTAETPSPPQAISSSLDFNVKQTESSNSPRGGDNGGDIEKPPIPALWLAIVGAFVWWKASQTNLEFALGYCGAYYFSGFCIVGVVWLFRGRSLRIWTVHEWLNYAAYAMLGVLALSFLVRMSLENSLDGATTHRNENAVAQPPADTHVPQSSPWSTSAHPEPTRQVEQLDLAATAPSLTKDQVRRIQTLLTHLGYKTGLVDGDAGPRTSTAIRAFERFHGIPETGEPTGQLLLLLESRASRVISSYVDKPHCVLKRVMTDADYRACGLNPPPSH